MVRQMFHGEAPVLKTQNVYFDRPRVNGILAEAMQAKVVSVCAGAGYGKTRAVRAFLNDYDAAVGWVQLSERDNFSARFWENFTHTISLYDQSLARQLVEVGFPETEEDYERYMRVPERAILPNQRHVMVYDDFHLIYDEAVLRFVEKCVLSPFSNITTVLISRTEPAINMLRLLSKKTVASIAENELRFTKGEVADFLRLQGLRVSLQSLEDIYANTEGWAFAVNLIGLSLKRNPGREKEACAAMRLNVFKLLESEVFLVISERLQRFMIRLSLIDHLSAGVVHRLAEDVTLVEELMQVNSYVRYDTYLDAYEIHHLLISYLRQKQDALTEEEKRETYAKAARWCDESGYKIDAVSYYEKAGEYDSVTRIVYDMPMPMPEKTAKYLLAVFEKIHPETAMRIIRFPVTHLRLLMSVRRLDEAFATARQYARAYEALPGSPSSNRVLASVYMAMGLARYLASPVTGVYDFGAYFEKEAEYYARCPYRITGPSTTHNIGPWASMVGTDRPGAHEEYIDALSHGVRHLARALDGYSSGLDELARGELYFFRGDMPISEILITKALLTTRQFNQYDLRHRALFYLMRIGFAQGYYAKVEQAMLELETLLDAPDYLNRYITYDIAASWRHVMLGQPHLIADWLKVGFEEGALAGFIADFSDLIRAKYYYAIGHYHELLLHIDAREKTTNILFGRVILKVEKALCRYQIKDRQGAMEALRQAYEMSRSNNFTMPFIECGKDMRTLTIAAMRDETANIPPEWLKLINRKSATYAKRQQIVIAAYKKAHDLKDEVSLSPRETEVLADLRQGLSRSEIAVTRNLSINTVKFLINTLYTKLKADNVADVIRIAAEKNLVH